MFAGETTFQKLTTSEAILEGIKHTFESVSLTVKSVIAMFTGILAWKMSQELWECIQ